MNDHAAGFATGVGTAGVLLLLERTTSQAVPLAEVMLVLAAVVLIPIGIIDFIGDRVRRRG